MPKPVKCKIYHSEDSKQGMFTVLKSPGKMILRNVQRARRYCASYMTQFLSFSLPFLPVIRFYQLSIGLMCFTTPNLITVLSICLVHLNSEGIFSGRLYMEIDILPCIVYSMTAN